MEWVEKRRQFDKLGLMKKVIRLVPLNKSESFDFDDWLKTSPAERLDTLQYLREMFYDLKHESRKGLQRVLKVTWRKRS